VGELHLQRFPGGSAQFGHQLEADGDGQVVNRVDGQHVAQRARMAQQCDVILGIGECALADPNGTPISASRAGRAMNGPTRAAPS
jgi:hypothetical protein